MNLLNKENFFRPKARLMLLLGDQLIRDAGIAVFELVKNSYDAMANNCNVIIYNIVDIEKAKIVIEDDGYGMSLETIKEVWLEPGTEHRKHEREKLLKFKGKKRLPLGEKGVGRFAVHKLGWKIKLITKSDHFKEVVVEINWNEFSKDDYLANIPVKIVEREPEHFKRGKTGTRIEISELRENYFTRGRIRNLYRSIYSICSPFGGPERFKAELFLNPDYGWLDNLLKPQDIMNYALFRFSGKIIGSELIYDYNFCPADSMDRVESREVYNKCISMLVEDTQSNKKRKIKPINLSYFKIGAIKIDLNIFDRDAKLLRLISHEPKMITELLNNSGGIRVYRDGMRVYDYGELGNDWLELGGRRVNIPTQRISNNQVIGAVTLNLKDSSDLIEKTNREGFVENDAFEEFREAIRFAVQQAEIERNHDKANVRIAYASNNVKEPVLDEIAALREIAKKKNLEGELNPYLSRIESQYRDVMDHLLVSAGSGLNVATILHEVDRGIESVKYAIKINKEKDEILALVNNLSDIVDNLTWLTRKSGSSSEYASIMIKQSISNWGFRFNNHKVSVVNGIDKGDPEFRIKCKRRLILACIANILDNSIYWLSSKSRNKSIYLGTTFEMNGLPSIVIADNGPGFLDPDHLLIQPFVTRKPDGMGLGLHIVNEIMKSHSGKVIFPKHKDITLPAEFDGAIVLLEFPEEI